MNKYEEEAERFGKTLGITPAEGWKKVASVLYEGETKEWLDNLYFAMVAIIKPKIENILEIGTGLGEKTNFLSRLFPSSTVYTLDLPFNDIDYRKRSWAWRKRNRNVPKLKENLDRLKIRSFKRNSFFLPMMELPKEFGLIFVDGGHDFPAVAWDTMFAYSRLSKDGFMFMHDYGSGNDVEKTIEYIAKRIPEKIHYLPSSLNPRGGKISCIWKEYK